MTSGRNSASQHVHVTTSTVREAACGVIQSCQPSSGDNSNVEARVSANGRLAQRPLADTAASLPIKNHQFLSKSVPSCLWSGHEEIPTTRKLVSRNKCCSNVCCITAWHFLTDEDQFNLSFGGAGPRLKVGRGLLTNVTIYAVTPLL